MISVSELIRKLTEHQPSYAQAKQHAEHIDALLGFRYQQIEADLVSQKENTARQFWIGLDIQSLQTPYSEIVDMLKQLNPEKNETWVDLGAGYGRMALVLGLLRPDLKFIGYEYVAPRVEEGQRILDTLNLKAENFQTMDLVSPDFKVNEGDVFFLYDFGSREDVYIVLGKLRKYAVNKSIRVITRGRAVKNWLLMDFPWLSGIHEPQHFGTWSLFRS